MLLRSCSLRFAFPSEAQQPTENPADRVSNWRLAIVSGTASRHFGRDCASLATSKGRTLSLSGDTAEGKLDRLPALAAELVRLKVDVIVTTAVRPTSCRQGSDHDDSHCHDADADPVDGFVASLARPGGISRACQRCAGAKRKAAGASERGCSQSSRRVAVLRTSDPTRATARILKETETRGAGVRSKASIPGRAKSRRILRPHFDAAARNVLRRSSFMTCTARFQLTEHRLSNSRQRTGCRRYIRQAVCGSRRA